MEAVMGILGKPGAIGAPGQTILGLPVKEWRKLPREDQIELMREHRDREIDNLAENPEPPTAGTDRIDLLDMGYTMTKHGQLEWFIEALRQEIARRELVRT
jgi:hypothetical protein